MTVTADDNKRVMLPAAKPGETFSVQMPTDGTFVLTRVGSVSSDPSTVRMEKRGRFTVGLLDRPIDEAALKDALADFP